MYLISIPHLPFSWCPLSLSIFSLLVNLIGMFRLLSLSGKPCPFPLQFDPNQLGNELGHFYNSYIRQLICKTQRYYDLCILVLISEGAQHFESRKPRFKSCLSYVSTLFLLQIPELPFSHLSNLEELYPPSFQPLLEDPLCSYLLLPFPVSLVNGAEWPTKGGSWHTQISFQPRL